MIDISKFAFEKTNIKGAIFKAITYCDNLSLKESKSNITLDFHPKTVIIGVFPYYSAKIFSGNLSAYSAVKDYHIVVKTRLEAICIELSNEYPSYKFAPFCDISPINEVMAALTAELGVLGENGLLITEEYGSYVFLGEILSDMPIDNAESAKIKSCISCGQCKNKCPANAINDKTKCISAISQKKGELNESEKALLKSNKTIWGCDICQLSCPMNKEPKTTKIEEFKTDIKPHLKLNELPENEQEFKLKYQGRAFVWRGLSTIKRNISLQGE